MNKDLKSKYNQYPVHIKSKMLSLRDLILDIAAKDKDIDFDKEDLKWGEPSFLTKTSGSTLRIDWKEKNPDSLSLFVNCQTKLINIFKELYPDDFEYIGNRELRLPLKGRYSRKNLKNCIRLVLKYNLLKDQF